MNLRRVGAEEFEKVRYFYRQLIDDMEGGKKYEAINENSSVLPPYPRQGFFCPELSFKQNKNAIRSCKFPRIHT